MARKRDTQHLAVTAIALTAIGMLGVAATAIFSIGKDVGAYEERLAQLERDRDEVARLQTR